jgi:hypothetical protein
MESDGASPLRIFPQAAITSDVFIEILSPTGPKGSMQQSGGWKSSQTERSQTGTQFKRSRARKTLVAYTVLN